MTPKNRQSLMAGPLIIVSAVILFGIVVITSVSVASIAGAQQQQTSGSKSGTIASIITITCHCV
jgi:hypothetical protein